MRITNDVSVKFANSPATDAFGRLRISEPSTLFDSKQLSDNLPLLWDDKQVSGSGTSSTFSSAKASSTLAVSATTAGKRVRQTFQRFNYQPGKSQQVLLTGTFSTLSAASSTGITSQIGIFDDNNGIFFSYASGVMYAVVRSKVTGSVVNNSVAQSSWNIDKMDGSGASGVTLDPTKTQICFIDYEWLGVGSVRVGFVIDRQIYYVHQFNHANSLAVVYMGTPNLPLRYSIENSGSGAACSMQHICSTVISEGGYEKIGVIRQIDNGVTEVTATTGGTTYALLGMRLNSAYLDSTVELLKASILMTSAGSYRWEILLNPTVAGTFTYANLANSGVDFVRGTSANTVTGGTSIAGDYGASTGSGSGAVSVTGALLATAIKIGCAIDGTRDTLVLAVTSLANGETYLGSITFREFS